MMPTPTLRAREMLADMPDKVFELWIEPLIKLDGWPFWTAKDLNFSGVWSQYLLRHSVETFNNLVWERKQIPCRLASFNPDSRKIIKWIIHAHVHGLLTPGTKIKKGRGKDSFLRSRQFIQRTARLHTPVVLWKQLNGYQIMDGNHRIAACFSFRTPGLILLDAWVGH